MKMLFALIAGVFFLSAPRSNAAESELLIHEWGTFTSLQDENGNAIGGINTDDEPVPHFVHRLADLLLLHPSEVPPLLFKGLPRRCHPDVTMRLETPVIYFHPPKSQTDIQTADLKVKFRGGWLSEFYPFANPEAPDLGTNRVQMGPLSSSTVSSLEWNELKIGGNWPLTNTTAHVWTSPRAVRAALVQAANGESEKFLFYRGVAHINAPLKISRDKITDQLLFRSQLESMPPDKPLSIRSLWLVDIRPDGKIAFRVLPPFELSPNPKKVSIRTTATFESRDFNSANREKLKATLHEALVADGLFSDEAQALLNTWELSYFKSAGLRVFFLVPQAWTDSCLPLDCSLPARINRIMVGRIELVTPEQRKHLELLGSFPASQITAEVGTLGTNFYSKLTSTEFDRNREAYEGVIAGKRPLASLISVPKTFQAYLKLGRFRNALVLDQVKQHSTPGLLRFIEAYHLEASEPFTSNQTGESRPNAGS
jgi:hypothetical protein